ncbi:MAG: dolichol-P-glucose synthetase [Chitinophagaceae bacterium]|nr:dolichol-P-glucose synthetase [Chitinophagaceae bacterium]
MKRILLTIFKYILAFGIAIVLLWWSLHGLSEKDTADIKAALLRANYAIIVPVFLILLVSHFFRALRWKQLIHTLGYKPPVIYLLCGILVGYIANQLIPRAGEIVRCTAIAKQTNIPAEKLIGTMVAERAFDVLCLLVITTGTLIIEYHAISAYALEIFTALKNGILYGGAKRWYILGGIIVSTIVIIWLVRQFKTHKRGMYIRKVFKGLAMGLSSIKNVKNKPLFFLYTLAIWTAYILATWMGCWALSETSVLKLDAALAMLVFGTFGIIVAPGGLGAYPLAIQRVLVQYNITETIALASGWLLWIAQFLFTVLFGTIAWLVIKFMKPPKTEQDSVLNNEISFSKTSH